MTTTPISNNLSSQLAKGIKKSLRSQGYNVQHSEVMTAIAHALGYENANAMRALNNDQSSTSLDFPEKTSKNSTSKDIFTSIDQSQQVQKAQRRGVLAEYVGAGWQWRLPASDPVDDTQYKSPKDAIEASTRIIDVILPPKPYLVRVDFWNNNDNPFQDSPYDSTTFAIAAPSRVAARKVAGCFAAELLGDQTDERPYYDETILGLEDLDEENLYNIIVKNLNTRTKCVDIPGFFAEEIRNETHSENPSATVRTALDTLKQLPSIVSDFVTNETDIDLAWNILVSELETYTLLKNPQTKLSDILDQT